MKIFYWYKECLFCGQGRLFVFKNLELCNLYFHCEECERGYLSPSDIMIKNSFLTLDFEFDSIEATEDDIKEAGWDNLELRQINEKK